MTFGVGCRLRLLAESKGFRLDDTGLFPATKSSGGKRVIKSSVCLLLSEIFIFSIYFSLSLRAIFDDSYWASLYLQGVRGMGSLKFETEKEVLEFLGFPWFEPNQRNL